MPYLDHFGLLAPYYDQAIGFRAFDKLVTLARLPVTGALLDAGGGTGRVTKALTGMANPIVVADISMGMLQQAAAQNHLETTCAYTECLPFPDQTFERIIIIDALHHVLSHQRTALELWRVLKPGGRILVEEPDIRTLAAKVVAIAEKIAFMRSHFISPPKIAALFPVPPAETAIELDGFNAWITIDKPG